MAQLLTKGNLAIFDYGETVENPFFEIDKEGVLFVQGRPMQFAGKEIGTIKRFDTGLKDYTAIGKPDYAKTVAQGDADIDEMIERVGLNGKTCIVLMKNPIEEAD